MDLFSIPELAQQVGTADNTVRRYLKRFPEYFYSQTTGGIKRYPREALDILKFIFNEYNFNSKTKAEIKQALESEYGNTIPIETAQAPANELTLTHRHKTPDVSIKPEISRLADAFERIATVLENQNTGPGSQPAVTENQLIQDKEILTDKETAVFLGVADRTLRDWRKSGKGPDYAQMGSKIRYRKIDINEYLDRQIISMEQGSKNKLK